MNKHFSYLYQSWTIFFQYFIHNSYVIPWRWHKNSVNRNKFFWCNIITHACVEENELNLIEFHIMDDPRYTVTLLEYELLFIHFSILKIVHTSIVEEHLYLRFIYITKYQLSTHSFIRSKNWVNFGWN